MKYICENGEYTFPESFEEDDLQSLLDQFIQGQINDGKLVLSAVVYFTTDYSQGCDQFEQLEKISKMVKQCNMK